MDPELKTLDGRVTENLKRPTKLDAWWFNWQWRIMMARGYLEAKYMETFLKKTHAEIMPLAQKKKWCKQVLVWNGIFESTVEAPAPVITFKTLQQSKVCTSEASPWHNHKGQPVTTRHNSPVVHSPRKFWSFPTAKRQNAIYPSKSMPRPARGWRCFLKMYVCVGVAFSEKNNPLPSNNPSHCLSFKMILDRFLNGAP